MADRKQREEDQKGPMGQVIPKDWFPVTNFLHLDATS
jgi:hypothetical protein